MAHILIVLPYSGTKFGGGLAVLNQKLTRALAAQGHKVRLLTMQLPKAISLELDEHSPAEVITIQNKESAAMTAAGGAGGEEQRDRLYDLFNSEETLLGSLDISNKPVIDAIRCDGFEPTLIIGHSRFSGPAAIILKEKAFPEAKVEYFLHSFPVEGSALTGYAAYEMKVDAELAKQKFAKEKEWMPRADVVVAMGPLIRAGAMMILEGLEAKGPRVHEAIPGIELTTENSVTFRGNSVPNLLFCGRASAPIKGLEDLLLAIRILLNKKNIPVHLDVLWWEPVTYENNPPRMMGSEQWVGAKPDQKEAGPDQKEAGKPGQEANGTTMASRLVDGASAQDWIDGMLNTRGAVTILGKANDSEEVVEAYRNHDAVLMPSYIEHFGLVPFEAAGHGVPVLVNQVSGSGMFLADPNRFREVGAKCVVKDFSGSMQDPRDFLVNVLPNAFEKRPEAWADAIEALVRDLPGRYGNAVQLREMLGKYTYDHFAASVVAAVDPTWTGKATYQGPSGQVKAVGV